jgi:hypothetical protein
MKVIVGLIFLVAVGCYLVYDRGGYGSFDPTEQGRKVKAGITPGMAYGAVFDLAGDPTRFRIINRKVETVRGEEVVTFVPGPEVKTDRGRIKARVEENSLEHGFVCTYIFSHQAAFHIVFDGAGDVKDVTDAMTMADLLDTRQP